MPGDPGDELVDLLDDDGQVIGVVSRREMRARRLPHRCTYVLVFNGRGDLFIHLRTAAKDIFPSHWDVAIGGVLAAGEDWEPGTRREIQEELGIDALAQELFPFRHEDDQTGVFARVYRLVHEGPFQLQTEEIVRGEFVALDEVFRRARTQPFCPDGLAVFKEYLRRELPIFS